MLSVRKVFSQGWSSTIILLATLASAMLGAGLSGSAVAGLQGVQQQFACDMLPPCGGVPNYARSTAPQVVQTDFTLHYR